MSWSFQDLAKECGITVREISDAPELSGYYLLFNSQCKFIYVGKASNLKSILANHFSDSEDNKRIKGIARYAIWIPTSSTAEAEEAEGNIYDAWIKSTGMTPFANRVKPPKSKLSDDEIADAKRNRLIKDLELFADWLKQ